MAPDIAHHQRSFGSESGCVVSGTLHAEHERGQPTPTPGWCTGSLRVTKAGWSATNVVAVEFRGTTNYPES
jgi:hypothetical protein